MRTLEEIASTFQSVDAEMKVQLLLDFARKLPALPPRLASTKDEHRVHECMTPLFLWVEPQQDGTARLFVDVAEEAPTLRGIAGILVDVLDGAPRDAYERLPDDLIQALGLGDIIRMNRVLGIAVLLGRIRRAARAAA